MATHRLGRGDEDGEQASIERYIWGDEERLVFVTIIRVMNEWMGRRGFKGTIDCSHVKHG